MNKYTDFDSGYTGAIKLEIKRKDICNFIKENIYKPKRTFLDSIRKGFNIVNISKYLKIFKNEEFIQYFVGIEAYSAKNIINIIKYKYDDEDEHENSKNKNEMMKLNFEKIINLSLIEIGKESQKKLVHFIDFITGSRVLPVEIIIKPNTYDSMNQFTTTDDLKKKKNEYKSWPHYPLCKASTCFNTLNMPYIVDHDVDNLQWTVENCSANILNVLKDGIYKNVAFYDE